MSEFNKSRIQELMIDRATDCLSDEEHDELSSLLQQEDLSDDFCFEELVAGMQISYLNTDPVPLPEHIRASVIDQGETLLLPQAKELARQQHGRKAVADSTPSFPSRRESFAWIAMAASLLLAVFLWFEPGGQSVANKTDRVANKTDSVPDKTDSVPDKTDSVPDKTDSVPDKTDSFQDAAIGEPDKLARRLIAPSDQESLNNFINTEKAADTIKIELGRGNDDSGKNCEATVYWNRSLKKGFLKVNNLATNDPTDEQYQLWIIDSDRGIDDRPNAGVFDVASNGVNVFEFRSELKIGQLQGFAITVEEPGGVAKSDLSKIAAANLGS